MIEIINQTEIEVSKALNLNPPDVFVCENCGSEVPVAPGPSSQLTCNKCGKTMDQSVFLPLTRTQKLWVSEKGRKLLLKQSPKVGSFSCVSYYRDVIHFRHAIVENYEMKGDVTLPQAAAMLAAFWAGNSRGVLRLLDKDKEFVSKRLRELCQCDQDSSTAGLLWDWLNTIEIKNRVGRPPRTDTLVLLLDASVLMFCPNSYVHFLRDALRLRIHEYRVKPDHAAAHRETLDRFWKARRAVEVKCKRLWQAWFEDDPKSPPERWWERVGREQGLFGSGGD